jgi:phosphonate ABC transporter permease subunit PhnE
MKTPKPFWKSLLLGLVVLAGLIVYAYGFQVTGVNFQEINSPRRQESLARVLRALARPDILEYEKEEKRVETLISVPCPPGVDPSAPAQSPQDTSGQYLVAPACAEPRSRAMVEGFNFEPNTQGRLSFIPPSEVTLNLGNFQVDEAGHFELEVLVPARPNEEPQTIRTVTLQNVGAPHFTRTAGETWDKIIETVFLALLATTFGVLLAIPVSFFAARNLMRDITSTLSALALSILAWPLGIWLGSTIAGWIGEMSQRLTDNAFLSLAGLFVSTAMVWAIPRWALPQEEERAPEPALRAARLVALLLAALAGILGMFLLARLAIPLGAAAAARLGGLSFLGNFLTNLGEILDLLVGVVVALACGAVLSSIAGRFGKTLFLASSGPARLGLNLFLGTLAGATLGALLGAGIDTIYQLNNPLITLWWPAVAGAALGLLAAVLTRKRDILPVGLVIYSITRTLLNALRAIEALVMVIVFVVWVGIGPFAGVLALSLHTVAALAKLYSEQVESILPGPLEAIKATGATRLQTIIYAVIPQIIPPYISFTMYRWDINVRMSTIIGFAGGGGIGFLLSQNINLLNYRAASAQMLAIAIVVAMMDYLSSYLRERVV